MWNVAGKVWHGLLCVQVPVWLAQVLPPVLHISIFFAAECSEMLSTDCAAVPAALDNVLERIRLASENCVVRCQLLFVLVYVRIGIGSVSLWRNLLMWVIVFFYFK